MFHQYVACLSVYCYRSSQNIIKFGNVIHKSINYSRTASNRIISMEQLWVLVEISKYVTEWPAKLLISLSQSCPGDHSKMLKDMLMLLLGVQIANLYFIWKMVPITTVSRNKNLNSLLMSNCSPGLQFDMTH